MTNPAPPADPERVLIHRALDGKPTVIIITEQLPEFHNMAIQELGYRLEATLLAEALLAALPGGAVDRLLIELLKNRASRLGVKL